MTRRAAGAATLTALWLLLSGCSDSEQWNESRRMGVTGETSIVEIVKDLAALRPFTPESIAASTGLELNPVPAESNDYFLVYRSDLDSDRTLSQVEIRTPTDEGDAPDGILLIDLGGAECVSQKEIVEMYGEGELSGPTPREPVDSPIYLLYPQDWGWLRFGFAPTGRECLVTVVADATELPE